MGQSQNGQVAIFVTLYLRKLFTMQVQLHGPVLYGGCKFC